MRLPPPLIEAISRGLVRTLVRDGVLSTDHPHKTVAKIEKLITADLAVEDDIAEEARLLLLDHQEEIRGTNLEYHTLISKAKGQLARRRNYTLSVGPEKLSREKQHDLARQIVSILLEDDDVEYFVEDDKFHAAVRHALERQMAKDARREEAARRKVLAIRRRIPEGSAEYHALSRQFYKELLDKEG